MVDPPSRRVFIRCLTGDGVSMVFDCRDDRPRELQRRWTVAHHPGEGCKFSDLVALENRARPNSCDIRFDRTRFLSLSLFLSPSPSLSLSFFLSLYLVSLDSFPSLDFTKSKSVLRRSFSRRRWKMVEYRAKYHVSRDNRRIGKRPSFRRNRPASGPRHTTFTVENPFPPIEFSNAILPATSAQLFSSNSKREACLCLPLVARVVLEGGGYRAPS